MTKAHTRKDGESATQDNAAYLAARDDDIHLCGVYGRKSPDIVKKYVSIPVDDDGSINWFHGYAQSCGFILKVGTVDQHSEATRLVAKVIEQ